MVSVMTPCEMVPPAGASRLAVLLGEGTVGDPPAWWTFVLLSAKGRAA